MLQIHKLTRMQTPQSVLDTLVNRRQHLTRGVAVFAGAIDRAALRCIGLFAAVLFSLAAIWPTQASAQETLMPWEYRPYRIHCWVGVDPTLGWAAERVDIIKGEIVQAIENKFGPAVIVSAEPVPSNFEADVFYSSQQFKLESLLGRELVVVASKKNKEGKESRTVKAAIEKFKELPINASYFNDFKQHLESNATVEGFKEFASILKASEGPLTDINGQDPVAVSLLSGEIPIGVVSRSFAKSYPKELAILPVVYPWHLQSELSKYDKIMTINLRQIDVGIQAELREVDCLFRTVGAMLTQKTISEQDLSSTCATLAAEAFVPSVRMEVADDKIAKVRLRAGELIPEATQEDNPCFIGAGDVLRPVIRRDNLKGEPQMIQTVPWTYLVAVSKEKSNMECAIFSGTRGALLGRPNRRLYRLATLVKPSRDSTDLKLRVASAPDRVIPGNSIFKRTPGSDDLTLIGRSDWRGVLTIAQKENPMITYEVPIAGKPDSAKTETKPAMQLRRQRTRRRKRFSLRSVRFKQTRRFIFIMSKAAIAYWRSCQSSQAMNEWKLPIYRMTASD